jgi:hypothetical protein
MKPSSYLVLHLVHPTKFKNIISYPNTEISSTINNNNNNRELNNQVVFNDFSYIAKYEIPEDNTQSVLLTETFTDNINNNIRQNEQHMKMETIDTIINMASQNGFIIKGKSNINSTNDKHQFLYILERQM